MASEQGKTADEQLASDLANASLSHPTETSKAADDLANGTVEEEGDEEDDDEAGAGDEKVADVDAETGEAVSKKKKKKKSKKKKARPASESTTESSAATSSQPSKAPPADLKSLLNQLMLSQAQKKEGKAQEDYKFWNTQPVPKFQEPNLLQTTSSTGETLPEGPILPDKICKASAKAEPRPLRDGFEWYLVDLEDESELRELYDLLDNHYVEDADASFRFRYRVEFLSWALKPPGWKKDYHIGVRTASSQEGKKGKLVAFISGIPVKLKVGDSEMISTEINFLAIHRKLRGKRLAPELIKEVTRRCYRNDIFQALYTAGTLLPTPVSTCRYFHRSLDWEHLYKNGFSHLPPGSTELKQKYRYKLESHTTIEGLRPMKSADIPAVKDLLIRYLERFHLRQAWSTEEIEHWFCSSASSGVVWSYVVEVEGKITDFVSYYLLESTVLKSNDRTETIRAAYLFYYASESAFQPQSGPTKNAKQLQETLGARLQILIHDALILAKKEDFHVFNALTLLDNPLFLKEEKFEPGDGKLHYYLFNWRTIPIPGGIDVNNHVDTKKMGGVGIVML